MLQESLDFLLAGLFMQDRLLRMRVAPELPPLHELPSLKAWFAQEESERPRLLRDEIVEEAVTAAVAPVVTYETTSTVKYDHNVHYRLQQNAPNPAFYVHVPSWVKVSRAPFHTFGPNLFGLAYTSTGHVHIREDLEGDEFAEVLQHEVFHQLYPNCSEGQIRQFTLARFGERAAIHHRIGPGH